ncbi:hypothetical protein EU556_24255 [Hymenobacter fodinae]|uniref:Uncharacterized protein n=1 Tax=Hymenobacter fodinae TaxID=2510796 RepID=A0A4Z0NZV5_9BACT|nr:hypothetical protein EU556_24255 [Hymenobacter fodinae]
MTTAMPAGCSEKQAEENPLRDVSGRLYLVPLNEKYLELPSDSRLNLANPQVLLTMKQTGLCYRP